jgi:hypothetical protein
METKAAHIGTISMTSSFIILSAVIALPSVPSEYTEIIASVSENIANWRICIRSPPFSISGTKEK